MAAASQEPESRPEGKPAGRWDWIPSARAVGFALFLLLLILGVVFYLWWGFDYNGWLDNGVYAVTITLVALGLSGMLITAPPRAATPPS